MSEIFFLHKFGHLSFYRPQLADGERVSEINFMRYALEHQNLCETCDSLSFRYILDW